MKTCGKCIKFDFCKRYVTENESFPEMPKGCPEFKRKPLFKRKQKGVSIMPNKLTDAEVKKALGGAILNAKGYDSKVWSIEVYKLENALDLINRLKEKIEKLLYRNARLDVENNELQLEIKSCNAEIERLKNTLDDILDRQAILVERSEKYAKAEAYKEAFEKVKEELKNIAKIDWQGGYYYLIGEAFFDNLLNELVGDDNA